MEKDLFKELYLFELSRKEQLTGRVAVLLTAVTVVGALVGFLLEAHAISTDPLSLIFESLLMLAIFFYGSSVYYLTRLYSGYMYEAIPTPSKLKAYYQELVKFYNDNPEATGGASEKFQDYLNDRYAKATEINVLNNETKAAYHAKSLRALVFALLSLSLAAVPHLLKKSLMP